MSNRKEIELPDIEIDAGLLAQFEDLPDTARQTVKWTPQLDALLLKFWPIKNKEAVADAIGYCSYACRKRYKELTEKKK